MSRLGSGTGAVLSIGITEAIARCGIVAAPMDRRGSPIDDSVAGKAIASAGEAGCWYVCTWVCAGEEANTKKPGKQAEMDEVACGFSALGLPQNCFAGRSQAVDTIVQLPT